MFSVVKDYLKHPVGKFRWVSGFPVCIAIWFSIAVLDVLQVAIS